MAYVLSDFESQVRQFLDDTGLTNTNRVVEDLTYQLVGGNGSRVAFNLSRTNLVASVTQVSVNGAAFTTSGFTVDTTNGLVTFNSAPTLSTTVPTNLQVLYYYQNFLTSEIDNFINYGLNKIGLAQVTVNTDYTQVNAANFNVVCLYGAASGYSELAARYSRMVDASAEGKSMGKSSVSARYQELAQIYEDRAEQERLAAQGPRQGRSTVASSVTKAFVPRSALWGPPR